MAHREVAAVFLVTEDVEALLPFYEDVLGLTLGRHEPGHAAWFDTGKVSLVLHCPEAGEGGRDLTPPESVLVWLRPAEGVPALCKHLGEKGADVLQPAAADNYAYVRDPEGRVIGFHAPSE